MLEPLRAVEELEEGSWFSSSLKKSAETKVDEEAKRIYEKQDAVAEHTGPPTAARDVRKRSRGGLGCLYRGSFPYRSPPHLVPVWTRLSQPTWISAGLFSLLPSFPYTEGPLCAGVRPGPLQGCTQSASLIPSRSFSRGPAAGAPCRVTSCSCSQPRGSSISYLKFPLKRCGSQNIFTGRMKGDGLSSAASST